MSSLDKIWHLTQPQTRTSFHLDLTSHPSKHSSLKKCTWLNHKQEPRFIPHGWMLNDRSTYMRSQFHPKIVKAFFSGLQLFMAPPFLEFFVSNTCLGNPCFGEDGIQDARPPPTLPCTRAHQSFPVLCLSAPIKRVLHHFRQHRASSPKHAQGAPLDFQHTSRYPLCYHPWWVSPWCW